MWRHVSRECLARQGGEDGTDLGGRPRTEDARHYHLPAALQGGYDPIAELRTRGPDRAAHALCHTQARRLLWFEHYPGRLRFEPRGACQAILERWLNTDFVNLGFSGNGLGEPALADAIREIDASCIVLDFWGNPSPEQYTNALPVFVDHLREKRPEVPILVTSPFYFPSEETSAAMARMQNTKRQFAHDFVENRRKKGDHRITFVDGLKMLNRDQTSGLVDGVHCNSLGFYFNAQGLEPFLKKALRAVRGAPAPRRLDRRNAHSGRTQSSRADSISRRAPPADGSIPHHDHHRALEAVGMEGGEPVMLGLYFSPQLPLP